MRILVTGADGFTGRHFAASAGACGHEVVSLQSNLTDLDALIQETAQVAPEAVVHLAGISFVEHADAIVFYDVNVIGTLNLLDALVALEQPPGSVLLVSSANVYGNCKQSPITESQPPAPVNQYAMSKLAMEYMARTYLDRLPLFFVRPFNYTGPGQNINFVIPKLVDHFVRQAPVISLGNLHVEREFNDVQMVCETYIALLSCGQPGEIYNVCSGRPYSLSEVIQELTRISNHDLRVEVNPAFVRPNELHRLCGSPEKLLTLLSGHGVSLRIPTLVDTLKQMLVADGKS